jgi:hypothetical protein
MKTLPVNVGIAIVASTHIWMLNEIMPQSMVKYHAYINLIAVASIAYGIYS